MFRLVTDCETQGYGSMVRSSVQQQKRTLESGHRVLIREHGTINPQAANAPPLGSLAEAAPSMISNLGAGTNFILPRSRSICLLPIVAAVLPACLNALCSICLAASSKLSAGKLTKSGTGSVLVLFKFVMAAESNAASAKQLSQTSLLPPQSKLLRLDEGKLPLRTYRLLSPFPPLPQRQIAVAGAEEIAGRTPLISRNVVKLLLSLLVSEAASSSRPSEKLDGSGTEDVLSVLDSRPLLHLRTCLVAAAGVAGAGTGEPSEGELACDSAEGSHR